MPLYLPAMLRLPAYIAYAKRYLAGWHSDAGGAQELVKRMFYTYVLKSKKDGNLYIGFSSNLTQRISEHVKGLVDATKHRRPLELVYYEACIDEKKAVERERALKTGFGRSYLKRRI
jgi:putative endonuclease